MIPGTVMNYYTALSFLSKEHGEDDKRGKKRRLVVVV